MIGTTGGAVLVIVSILFAGLLGVGAGWLTCLVIRKRWGLRAAVIDSGLAAAVLVIATYAEMGIESASGIWESEETLILLIAASSAAAWEVFRPSQR
ncbi:MAG: hypothetical protein WAL75_04765 [Terracidiphilus sp.]